ncbi:MAG: glycosylasparaginase [Ignavibacteria bacterium]|nr:glycosylasparaginase [Ignavibacteria bacterium]
MINRRKFIINTVAAGAGLITSNKLLSQVEPEKKEPVIPSQPRYTKGLVISTWKHGLAANEAARKKIENGGSSLDAVESGVMVSEADPKVTSVGYGGLPDRDGRVTLDASIMDEKGNCGSVAFIEHIMHPISVARLVMEKTPHCMITGKGALKFALANGFKKENLLTDESKKRWEDWMKENNYKPDINEIHDTIGMLAIDKAGNLSGACTTSGLAWKYHGRVGDSPIIGAGLYVDNDVGAACATGKGEAVIKICGSFLIVELMRNGISPQKACETAVLRIAAKQRDYSQFQVGFLAVNTSGEIGAFSLQKGFEYALYSDGKNAMHESDYFLKVK